uniref:Uncharacterized protein n=1 Tax=Ciona intestinalis TaxID=7719 RepID=H2XQM1_CIOIN
IGSCHCEKGGITYPTSHLCERKTSFIVNLEHLVNCIHICCCSKIKPELVTSCSMDYLLVNLSMVYDKPE